VPSLSLRRTLGVEVRRPALGRHVGRLIVDVASVDEQLSRTTERRQRRQFECHQNQSVDFDVVPVHESRGGRRPTDDDLVHTMPILRSRGNVHSGVSDVQCFLSREVGLVVAFGIGVVDRELRVTRCRRSGMRPMDVEALSPFLPTPRCPLYRCFGLSDLPMYLVSLVKGHTNM